MNKISIIVPVYNTEKYVGRCIESILNQTYTNFELILINDGSTDSSAKICEQYAQKDDRILFKSIENAGVSNARNIALKLVSGEYITFVDSDDVIKKNYLQVMMNIVISSNSQIAFCNAYKCYDEDIDDFIISDDDTEEVFERFVIDKKFDIIANEYCTYMPGTFMKKECISDLKFNTELFVGEDSLFIFEAMLKSKYIAYTDRALYGYYQRTDSATGNTPYNKKKFTEVKAWEIINKKAKKIGGKLYYSSKALIGFSGYKGILYMKRNGGYDKKIWKYCVKSLRKEVKNVVFSKIDKKIKIHYLLSFFFPDIYMSFLNKYKK